MKIDMFYYKHDTQMSLMQFSIWSTLLR